MVSTKEYQEEIKEKLSKILLLDTSIERRMKMPSYSPRVDVAIPPFAFDQSYARDYKSLLKRNKVFLEKLKEKALNDNQRVKFDKNPNPRCFIAIEIENSTDNNAKHMLGSIANASILGKVGIVIAMNSSNCLKRINEYFDYITQAGKIKNEFKNVLLISKKDFDTVLNEFAKPN